MDKKFGHIGNRTHIMSHLDTMPLAYAYHSVEYDHAGTPRDYKFLYINQEFERLTGICAADAIGKTVTEVLPDSGQDRFNWIREYGEIAAYGLSRQFDQYSGVLKKWFRIHAFSSEKGFFTTVFTDITDMVQKIGEQQIMHTMLNDILFELDEDLCFTNVLIDDEKKLFRNREDIIGSDVGDLFPDGVTEEIRKAFYKARNEGTRECVIYPSPLQGDDRWYQALVKHAQLGREKRYVVSISEITNRKKLEQELCSREELFRTIFEQVPIGIVLAGENNRFIEINSEFERITGRTRQQLLSLGWEDITHPDDIPTSRDFLRRFQYDKKEGAELVKRYIKLDGSVAWIRLNIAPLKLGGSEIDRICLVEDITEYKRAEDELRESERSKSVFLSNLPGMAYRCRIDRQWTMLFVSEGCYELTGYRAESLLYNRELSYNELVVPEYREELWNLWDRVVKTRGHFRGEYQIVTSSGQRKWVLELGQPIYNGNGDVTVLEGIVIDITDQKNREARIRYLSERDSLTGLYNRSYYEQELLRLDTENHYPLSILVGDINGVKMINDAFGFAEGDRMIRLTSEILGSCCRAQDILARVGGGEFGLLLPRTDEAGAFAILKKINEACERHNAEIRNEDFCISLSLGYATKAQGEADIREIAKIAEDYMYKRKLLGNRSSHKAILSYIRAAMYAKSQETEEHAERLWSLTRAMGVRLGLQQKELGDLELFSMLHDIGKMGIDDGILNKPGKLTPDEWEIMKKHPEIGYRIVMSSPELDTISEYILSHHEHWDGSGYPRGLKGEQIPLLSRILAVADAYDAMTTDRPYRAAMRPAEALKEIAACTGTYFDPAITEVFLDIMHKRGLTE